MLWVVWEDHQCLLVHLKRGCRELGSEYVYKDGMYCGPWSRRSVTPWQDCDMAVAPALPHDALALNVALALPHDALALNVALAVALDAALALHTLMLRRFGLPMCKSWTHHTA